MMSYIPPEERIPGLQATVKAAQEEFDKRPSEATHDALAKAKTALDLTKALITNVTPVGTYRDRE
jgi:hypothetical protein